MIIVGLAGEYVCCYGVNDYRRGVCKCDKRQDQEKVIFNLELVDSLDEEKPAR